MSCIITATYKTDVGSRSHVSTLTRDEIRDRIAKRSKKHASLIYKEYLLAATFEALADVPDADVKDLLTLKIIETPV